MSRRLLVFMLYLAGWSALSLCPNTLLARQSENILLSPGSDRVSGSDIESYTARWRQIVTSPDGSARAGINTIHDSTTVEKRGDMDVIVRRMLWVDTDKNTYRRTDVLNRSTLAPLVLDIRSSPSSVSRADVNGAHIRGFSVSDLTSSATWSDTHLDDVFFNWSSDGFLLNGLDLNSAGTYELRTGHNLTGAPVLGGQTFEVAGRERIETEPFGTHDTVIVEQKNSPAWWGRYWISESAPYIVQVEFTQQDGTVTRWELF